MFFHRQGEIRAALDGGVVGHEHAFHAVHPADAGNNARAGNVGVINLVGGQGGKFHKRRARVDDAVDPLPGQELVALPVLGYRLPAAASFDNSQFFFEFFGQLKIVIPVFQILFGRCIHLRNDLIHPPAYAL